MVVKGQHDLLSNIILFLISLVSITWIVIPQPFLVLIGSILAIVITMIYTRRISKLGTDETPISDSLIAISGVIIGLQLSGVYLDLDFLNNFGLNHAIISLLFGSIFKLFLLDRVILELINQIRNSFNYIFDWSTNNFINMTRLIFLALSIGFFSFDIFLNSVFLIDFSLGLSYLFASLVLLLSSLNPWGERYETIRVIAIFTLVIISLQNYDISVLIIEISLRILFFSIIIFCFSIPSIIKFFKINLYIISDFISKYLLVSLRLFSFIVSWFVLQLTSFPFNIIGFAGLLVFSLWVYIMAVLKFVYNTSISTYKFVIRHLRTNLLQVMRFFSGIFGIGLLITSSYIQGYYLFYYGIGFIIFALSGLIIKFSKAIYEGLSEFIGEMVLALKTLYHSIRGNPLQFIRITSGIVALVSYYYSLSSESNVWYYLAIFFALVAFSKIFQDVVILLYQSIMIGYLAFSKWIKEDPILHTRIISGYASGVLFFINLFLGLTFLSAMVVVLLSFALLPYFIKQFKLFVRLVFTHKRISWQVTTGILSILSFRLLGRIPVFGIFSNKFFGYTFLFFALLPWTYDFLKWLLPLIYSFLTYLSSNKKIAFQLISGILSILSFVFLGGYLIFGINSNRLFGYTFLFFTLLPWIYDFLDTIMPIIIDILRYFRYHIFVVDKLSAISATVLLFFRKLMPENYLSIFYISIAILYSMSFDYFVLKFIDSLAQGVYGFVYSFVSFFSTILRVLRNIGIWKIIPSLVKRLIRLLQSLLKFIYRNIVLIVLYLISFVFVLMGIGILIPWVFPLSGIIFAGIKGNFIVSFIVTIFLISLGGLGFREITDRRSQFQLEVAK